jgi:hypothetical protein
MKEVIIKESNGYCDGFQVHTAPHETIKAGGFDKSDNPVLIIWDSKRSNYRLDVLIAGIRSPLENSPEWQKINFRFCTMLRESVDGFEVSTIPNGWESV